MASVYVGTSGWSYKDWGKRFYPPGLPARDQLVYLAKTFNTVELNASFYRLPQAKTFEHWQSVTPPDFRFAVKLSRYITHVKKMADVRESWSLFLSRAELLGNKLGVILIQLPPSFAATNVNLERLEQFLSYATAAGRRLAFEFRHPTCFEPPLLDVLSKHRVCLASAESSRFPHSPPNFAPANFVYYRFHGPAKLYASPYGPEALTPWAIQMKRHLKTGKDIFAYFDNDNHGYALEDARCLQKLTV